MRAGAHRPLHAVAALTAAALCAAQANGQDEGKDVDIVADNPHGSFRADCNTCHLIDSWKPAKLGSQFDHSQFGYALDGAHRDAPCLLCHVSLEFTPVFGTRCEECHQDVHAGELGTECEQCHSTRSFIDRTGDVRSHRFSRFPLTGAHATVDCEGCHGPSGAASMQFLNTPTDCFACHADLYRTAVPAHTPPEFPTDCMLCHDTFRWAGGPAGGPFDHALTAFPLTGAHRTVSCEACHTNGQYAGTATDCFACHSAQYEAATAPPHTPQFFPIDCATCHGTATWQGADFAAHDALYFPVYSGAHQGVWQQDCATCHTQPSSYQAFLCLDCHTHRQSVEDARHQGIGGYQYESGSCFACHPNGEG